MIDMGGACRIDGVHDDHVAQAIRGNTVGKDAGQLLGFIAT